MPADQQFLMTFQDMPEVWRLLSPSLQVVELLPQSLCAVLEDKQLYMAGLLSLSWKNAGKSLESRFVLAVLDGNHHVVYWTDDDLAIFIVTVGRAESALQDILLVGGEDSVDTSTGWGRAGPKPTPRD
jgi:hypothetical protein